MIAESPTNMKFDVLFDAKSGELRPWTYPREHEQLRCAICTATNNYLFNRSINVPVARFNANGSFGAADSVDDDLLIKALVIIWILGCLINLYASANV